MKHEVKLPSLGDDAVEEAVVSCWLVEEGDLVHEGDELIEMTSDKAAFSIQSPKTGTVFEKVVEEGDEVAVGDVLCVLEF